MKKTLLVLILGIIAAICCAFALSACGGNANNNPPSGTNPPSGNTGDTNTPDDNTGHICYYGEWQVITPATCTTRGEEICYCVFDSTHTKTRKTPIDPMAHDWGEWQVTTPATCTTQGEETRVCKLNNLHFDKRATSTDPTVHTYGKLIGEVSATCSETGVIAHYHCACGKYFDEDKTEVSEENLVIAKDSTAHKYNTENKCELCNYVLEYTQGLEYQINSDNTAYTLTGIGQAEATDIVIPYYYEGLPVTSIGSSAFYNCTNLTSITIPDSVTSIGGRSAFWGCNKLIQTENGVQYVDKWVVGCDSSVSTANLKANTKGIADYAFYGCTSLTNITIPESVIYIGDSAFSGCSKLESITLPFVGGSKNATTASKSTLFGYIFGKNSYTGGVRTEQEYGSSSSAYEYYYIPASLKSVTITDGNILYGAFHNCSSLKSITIPNFVTSIGSYAFSGCTAEIKWGDNPSITQIGDYAFSGYNGISITIPESVIYIGYRAFSGCTNLTSITIPDSVTSIGSDAFNGCEKLIQTENGVQYVDKWVVGYDDTISSAITLKADTKGIAVSAFSSCTNLTSVTIPDSVTSIGDGAFGWCTSLANITIPDSVISIGDSAFVVCTNLTSITIPDSVISIGERAFEDCTNLESVNFGNNSQLESIGDYAFNTCINLKSINIPNSVTSIGSWAFEDCTNLESVNFGNNSKLESIGNSAFYDCESLTSITIPDSVTFIGEEAFEYCKNLTSITIPDSVTSIGMVAFFGCTSLESVIFQNTTGWKVSTSSNMSNAKDVNVTDAANNAKLLTVSYFGYSDYYWHRYDA